MDENSDSFWTICCCFYFVEKLSQCTELNKIFALYCSPIAPMPLNLNSIAQENVKALLAPESY